MRASIVLATLAVAIATVSGSRQLVPTTIERHPSVVALLRTINFATPLTACAGAILTNRSILTAARCFESDGPERWRIRAGSTKWDQGGVVYPASEIIRHDDWDEWAMGTDVAILRSASAIAFSSTVQGGQFAGPGYIVGELQPLVAVGWGYTSMPLWAPTEFENLQETQLANFNVDVCRPFYSAAGFWLRDNQACVGFANTNQNVPEVRCLGEPGAPLYHNGVIVAIRSYALSCRSDPGVPTANTRVGPFLDWIVDNA